MATKNRRADLLSRKKIIFEGLEDKLNAANLPQKDHYAATVMLDAFELLLDVLVDVAHPVDNGK